MSTSKAYIGHIMILATILIYSLNTNLVKVIIPHWIQPNGLVLFQCAFSALVFWVIALFKTPHKDSPSPSRKDILMMVLCGVLGKGLNLLLYINGLELTGPIDAFVIRTSTPILVILLGVLLSRSAFTRYKILGLILGMAGALYAIIIPHAEKVKGSLSGDTLIFLSAFSLALFLILVKPYTKKFDTITVMKWMSLSSTLFVLPFGYNQMLDATLFSVHTPIHIWLEMGYILLSTSVIAFFLSIYALNYITPFVESAYQYLLPVTGAAVSILMGLQKFSWHYPIALILIIIGFLFINKKNKAKSRKASSTIKIVFF